MPIFYINCEFFFSLYTCKTKAKKNNSQIYKKNSWIYKIFKNLILLEANFWPWSFYHQ